jgi:hypothetical protein
VGLVSTAAFAHFVVRVESLGASFRLHRLRPQGVQAFQKPSVGRDCESCRKPPTPYGTVNANPNFRATSAIVRPSENCYKSIARALKRATG